MDNDRGDGKANRLVFAIFDEECERLEVFFFRHRLSHLAMLTIALCADSAWVFDKLGLSRENRLGDGADI
jgi:hypothetical protein